MICAISDQSMLFYGYDTIWLLEKRKKRNIPNSKKILIETNLYTFSALLPNAVMEQ